MSKQQVKFKCKSLNLLKIVPYLIAALIATLGHSVDSLIVFWLFCCFLLFGCSMWRNKVLNSVQRKWLLMAIVVWPFKIRYSTPGNRPKSALDLTVLSWTYDEHCQSMEFAIVNITLGVILIAAVATPMFGRCRSAALSTSDSKAAGGRPESALAPVLSSRLTTETGCGSPQTPWIVEVEPGQRINMTLVDFTVTSSTMNNASLRYESIDKTVSPFDIPICHLRTSSAVRCVYFGIPCSGNLSGFLHPQLEHDSPLVVKYLIIMIEILFVLIVHIIKQYKQTTL